MNDPVEEEERISEMKFFGGTTSQCSKTVLRTDDEPSFRAIYTVLNLLINSQKGTCFIKSMSENYAKHRYISLNSSVYAPQQKKSCSENVFWQQRAVKANQSRSTVQPFVYRIEWRKEGRGEEEEPFLAKFS